jgi:putative hydrolase of the HAD superfamily
MKLRPLAGIPDPGSVRNIIFDFGGVICDLDIERTKEKFVAFGPPKEPSAVSPGESDRAFNLLVEMLESGQIPPAFFRETIRNHYISAPSDEQIDDAWNALLLDIPPARIRLLETIRDRYRIFLLSNSNQIHYECYSRRFSQAFGYPDFDALFEKAWFSYRIRMKKPDREIFEFVLADKGLDPAETLFIDDTLMHVQAAQAIGIRGYHLVPGVDITDLFS